jgi:hypothetical protein
VGACVAKYAIQIKPSARRELENLSDRLIARLMPLTRVIEHHSACMSKILEKQKRGN